MLKLPMWCSQWAIGAGVVVVSGSMQCVMDLWSVKRCMGTAVERR